MEAAALFALAARLGARAGCVLGISNALVGERPEWLGPSERRELGLDAARAGLDALVAAG